MCSCVTLPVTLQRKWGLEDHDPFTEEGVEERIALSKITEQVKGQGVGFEPNSPTDTSHT